MPWRESDSEEVLRPEQAWEGADIEIEPLRRNEAAKRVNQLRDTVLHEERAGSSCSTLADANGIGIAELVKWCTRSLPWGK